MPRLTNLLCLPLLLALVATAGAQTNGRLATPADKQPPAAVPMQGTLTPCQGISCDAIIITSPPPRISEPPHHFYRSGWFWAGEAVIVSVAVLDGTSSIRAQRNGGTETGLVAGALAGPHPSSGQYLGYSFLEAGLGTGFHIAGWRLMQNDDSRAWRTAGKWYTPMIWAGFGGKAIAGNYAIHKQPSGQ